jgi:5-hydroxyisourate hydrolase-like protein (transthyretin family)
MLKFPKKVALNPFWILLIFLCGVLIFTQTDSSFAWSNGGNNRSYDFEQTAKKAADINIKDYKLFSINVKPIERKSGYGFGTHDFMFEQAMAEAIKGGADVSWVKIAIAQKNTSSPDYWTSVKKRFPLGGDYHGGGWGTGPRDIGILYKEIAKAINKKNYTEASQKLGWLAHYICDLTMPMHIYNGTQASPFKDVSSSGRHQIHLAVEYDLDYYMEESISVLKRKWRSDFKKILKYFPALDDVKEEIVSTDGSIIQNGTTPQEIRTLWFGGTVPTAKPTTYSARRLAISVASNVRNKYGKSFFKAWRKAYKKGFKATSTIGKYTVKSGGTEYIVKNAPGMLKYSADALGKIIATLSNPKTRMDGLDQVRTPSLKTSKKYIKYKKKKAMKLTTTIKIRNKKSGSAASGIPVKIKFRKNNKTLKTLTKYTNSKGIIKISHTYYREKKKTNAIAEASFPTTNYDKTRKKTRAIAKK